MGGGERRTALSGRDDDDVASKQHLQSNPGVGVNPKKNERSVVVGVDVVALHRGD